VAGRPRPRVQVDDALECILADAAERDVVAREHHAVELRPVEGLRVVVRALEGADLACIFGRPEQ
jgi:hypothetical protein